MVNDQIHELDLNETILADENGVIPERKHPFTLQNLEQGSVQKISIRAINDNTTSHYVDKSLILLLNTPRNVTVTPTDNNIHLAWSPVKKATAYRVSLEADGKFTNVTVDSASHTFFNLQSGLKYTLTVGAINDVTKSRLAKVETFTRLETVTGIKISDIEPTWFALNWIGISSASEYVVTVIEHENAALNITESTLMKFVTNQTKFVVENLNPGTKHTYSVAGRNKG